jgi:hypothetical protein
MIDCGEWFEGHGIARVEIYVSGQAKGEADPDHRIHFCSRKCFDEYLNGLLPQTIPDSAASTTSGKETH